MQLLVILCIIVVLPTLNRTIETKAFNKVFPQGCYINSDLILFFSERRPNPDPAICNLLICLSGNILFTVDCDDQYPRFSAPTELAQCAFGDPVDQSSLFPYCCIRKLICSRPRRNPDQLSYLTRLMRQVEKDYARLLQLNEDDGTHIDNATRTLKL